VQVVILLELAQLRLARLEQSDPDEFGAIGCTADRLIERDRADPLAIAIETGGDDAHRGRLSEAPRDAAAAKDQGGGNVRIRRQHDVLLPFGFAQPALCGRPTPGFLKVTSWITVSCRGTMRLAWSGFNRSGRAAAESVGADKLAIRSAEPATKRTQPPRVDPSGAPQRPAGRVAGRGWTMQARGQVNPIRFEAGP
jgi:hypothetical protein